jgi:DNA-binding GntR family transcriptional regulator
MTSSAETRAGPAATASVERVVALAREILTVAAGEGWSAGDRLPEPRLAALCRVSRTPIRKALEHLERLGLAHQRPEGGFCLAVDPTSAVLDQAMAHRPPVDPLFRTILAERFAGLIGDELSAAQLMERYGVSRGKAHDVLESLRESGVVRRSVGHSWIFAAGLADEASYRESLDFRLILEPAALLAPGFRAAPRVFAVLRRRHEAALDQQVPVIAALVELDTTFHDELAACSGNRFLRVAVQQHTALRRADEFQIHAMRGNFVETLREHLGILDALEADDRELAADRLRSHLVASHDRQPSIDQAKALAYRRLVRR